MKLLVASVKQNIPLTNLAIYGNLQEEMEYSRQYCNNFLSDWRIRVDMENIEFCSSLHDTNCKYHPFILLEREEERHSGRDTFLKNLLYIQMSCFKENVPFSAYFPAVSSLFPAVPSNDSIAESFSSTVKLFYQSCNFFFLVYHLLFFLFCCLRIWIFISTAFFLWTLELCCHILSNLLQHFSWTFL